MTNFSDALETILKTFAKKTPLPEEFKVEVDNKLKKIGYDEKQQARWWDSFYKYWISNTIKELVVSMSTQEMKQIVFNAIKKNDSSSVEGFDHQKLENALSKNFKNSLEYFINLTARPVS